MVRGLDVFREHFEGSHLTPIPIDEAVASLSANLLDDAYYEFILAGRREVDCLAWVGEDRLIPLKASAWLELGKRVITADTDVRLCRCFGLSDGWWLHLQADYDTELAKAALAKSLAKITPWKEAAEQPVDAH